MFNNPFFIPKLIYMICALDKYSTNNYNKGEEKVIIDNIKHIA